MLSFASVHLRNLYFSTLDYLQITSSPVFALSNIPEHAATNFNNLREPSAAHVPALNISPTSLPPSQTSIFMRRELEYTKSELAHTKNDVAILEDRCKMLERKLRDTRDILRTREAEVEKVRKERDRERKRSRSGSVPHYPHDYKADVAHSRHNSDTKPSSHHARSASSVRSPASSAATKAKVASLPTPPALPSASSSPRPPQSNASTLGQAEERARLKSSEAYLTRTDSWSGAQVLQALQDINAEIFQFAASATEVCAFSPAIVSARSGQAMHDTSTRLGPRFTRILAGRDHSQDPLLVQWALQGCVAVCMARALSAFCFGFPAEADNILSQIYRRMALAEPQPTSSKWRALTHRNIHAVYPTLDDYAVQKLTDTIIRWSADIFLVSGCTSFNDPSSGNALLSTSPPSFASPSSSPPNSRPLSTKPSFSSLGSHSSHATSSYAPSHASTTTSANPGIAFIRESLKSHFGDLIRRLARSATKLATTLREEILSTSFEAVAVDHTQAYDAASMQDIMREHACTAQSTPGMNGKTNGATAVLATTELGLLCTTRIGNRESVGDEDVTIEKRLILKPKVVLENVLEMLDR
ncbi:hypothetical protein JOM56_013908 [Amanita muscaria]